MECLGRIEPIEASFRKPFDVLVFNDEPQWSLVDRFKEIGLTVYYLLGFAALYGKPGSRESYRFPVDLRLANSHWTADRVGEEIGVRPVVVLPGINRSHFRPVRMNKKYDVLTYGSARAMKGTAEVEEACRKLGVGLAKYEGKNLPQSKLAEEYCRARVFAVGSYVEGFGMPGLEALACGVSLVTTDNGGCREYAFHEETALVVPPRDSDALASAIKRLLDDRALAERLRANGLRLAHEKFGWPEAARQFEEITEKALAARRQLTLAVDRVERNPELEGLRRLRAGQVGAFTQPLALPPDKGEPSRKLTSIITLSWDQPYYLERLVESVRANTDAPYELIVVDNGSRDETRRYVRSAADKHLLNPENVGFAKGMNQGAKLAAGDYLVFINNDAEAPPGWLPKLIEAQNLTDRVGIVAPAVTAGGSFVTVRAEPHEMVREVLPFSLPPAAVCYLLPRAEFEAAGGWCEEYRLGGAEDIDLCFTMWARGRRVLVDERALITHHSKGTAAAKLGDWEEIWRQNRALLMDRWSTAEPLIAPPDGELGEALAELRRSAQGEQLAPLVDRLESLLAERERAWAAERAMMAAGVAQSWREAARQREVAVNLRKELRAGLWKHLWRLYLRPRLRGRG
jgi:GT2 family glycosyltransferase